ncbi:hypothetical protein AB9F36_34060, partial [Rhizobium leguminosarum]|uniref:hypothetical protein n=1 Tax=Rhizobium leguminosarum TaxID=384 RepID=UPI003F94A350
VGNARLLAREGIDPGDLGREHDRIAGGGATAVLVAVDGVPRAAIGIADAPRATAVTAVAALREAGIEPVMLTGDNE